MWPLIFSDVEIYIGQSAAAAQRLLDGLLQHLGVAVGEEEIAVDVALDTVDDALLRLGLEPRTHLVHALVPTNVIQLVNLPRELRFLSLDDEELLQLPIDAHSRSGRRVVVVKAQGTAPAQTGHVQFRHFSKSVPPHFQYPGFS